MDCDKTEESSVQIFILYTKDHIALFCAKQNGWWSNPLYL